ncbi:MAG: hypothetical protein PHW04_12255 [Candidatus Wallbacteria bacterium]|nr:hypothetical protein [Candidatus Wallbacteria bacterium]
MKRILCFALILCACLLTASVNTDLKAVPVNKPLSITGIEQIDDQTVKLNAYMEHFQGNSYSVKPWTDEIALPQDLAAKGFKLYKREFVKMEGTYFWMLDEDMEGLGYSCSLVQTLPQSMGGNPIKITYAFYAGTSPELPEKLAPPRILYPPSNGLLEFYNPNYYYTVINYTGEGSAYRVSIDGHNGDEVMHRILYKAGSRDLKYDCFEDGCTYEAVVQQTDNTMRWSVPAASTFKVVFRFRLCNYCGATGQIRCDKCNGSGHYYDYNAHPAAYVQCTICNGTGKIKCNWCWGQGYTYK